MYKHNQDLPSRLLSKRSHCKNNWNEPNIVFPQKRVKNTNTFNIYGHNLGIYTNDIPFCIDNNDQYNLLTAYFKRLSPEMPKIDKSYLEVLKSETLHFLSKNLTPLPTMVNYEQLLEDWLASCKHYSSNRKKQLRIAFQSLTIKQLCKRDYVCKSFVKREFYEEAKFLRFINSRTDRFKCKVGPFIKYIEEQMYKLKWFVKGRDVSKLPEEIAKLNRYPYYLQTDYTSFESSFDPEYVDVVECQLWRYMLVNNPEILECVMRCYYTGTKGNLQPRIEVLLNKNYTLYARGARMSGEMWTSLANGFSNLMNMFTICKIHNIDFEGFVEGDDGIFNLNKNIITENDFNALGFKIKMKLSQNIEDTTFCGNLFSKESQKLILNPEYLARLGWSCSSIYSRSSKKITDELLRAKAMSIHVLGKYTPIIGKLTYKLLNILGEGEYRNEVSSKWWDFYVYTNTENKNFEWIEPVMSDRLLYYKNFGISIEMQLMLEASIEKATTVQDLCMPFRFMKKSYDTGLTFY